MTAFFRATLMALTLIAALPALAQTADRYIQIEAQSGVNAALRAAQRYDARLDRVEGYRLGATNWYAIVLGPFTEQQANQVRRDLRSRRAIPGDSFLTDGGSFRQKFWPDETATVPNALPEPVETATLREVTPETTPAPEEAPANLLPAPPAQPGETRDQALRSERDLDRDARRDLQVALRWAGYYDAAIDGAFGRGTRGAMADWQAARGFESTGVLTTLQRVALIREYNSVLDGLGLQRVTDDVAGITVMMPTALVDFETYEPPFVHYAPTDPDGIHKVLLISQRGDRANLYGLFDIMQTLEIVPPEGPREKRDRGFTLVGEGKDFISQTEARLRDGHVKGFTLIWPTGDEARRKRVIEEMIASFDANPDVVMDDMVGEPSEDQSIDLLAGLQIRRPETVRSGFYVSRRGQVLTSADAAQSCQRITLNNDVDARVIAVDAAAGLALLEPTQPLAPRAHAAFQAAVPRLKSQAILAGFSFDGALGAPSLSYGELADMRGLNGEESVKRFALAAQPSDAGGPVLDSTGAVLGMLLPGPVESGRVLPEGVAFAADVETIDAFLGANGIDAPAARGNARLARRALEDRATDMTVLVGCWK
ncbi:trypsin-like peptidase domain-containing protein [Maribius pontilimi]|uniref:Trypsin-like peptidase domain-containing protein n=1 Tax=Palleronia pontilimi TaxID=1964209 RepID=A0A934IFY9_9RHOB|nr:trypsin-like peptidase domain-containing protein [Palleronia pontilimi]MBJ3762178.1 trypsin-like peptidase domain-containing protein [Palleronia pontilimi]